MGHDRIVVAGTDTGVGKTMVAAMLTLGLDACYFKPLQSGTQGGTDTERVKALTGLPAGHFLPERYVFSRPLSPHRASELDGVEINPRALTLPPPASRPLVVELAGGLLVPVTRSLLQIDVLASWRVPVVLCSRTTLGTINHTLLSCEALRQRGIAVLGLAFVGDANEDSERTICAFSALRRLGRLPWIKKPTPAALRKAFKGFRV